MSFVLVLAMVASLATVFASAGILDNAKKATFSARYHNDDTVVLIVTAEGGAASDFGSVGSEEAAKRLEEIADEHKALFAAMEALNIEYELVYDYSKLMNGFSVGSCESRYRS